MSPRTASPDNPTRQKLLDAARQLFHSQGYHATGLAQILKESGVNSGSLYHFFGGKEDLLIGVLTQYKEGLWPWLLQPIFESVEDPLERIFALLDGYRQMLQRSEFRSGCPIGKLALELDEFHPDATVLVADNFSGWRDAVRECLEQAGLPDEVNASALATFVLTTMEGAVMQSRSYRSIEPFDDSVAMLRDYLNRLLVDPQHKANGDGK